jgi:hypothetical protein
MSSFKSLVKKKPSQEINLYLDLDETLIYSKDIRHQKTIPTYVEQFKHHNFENAYVILERPGLQDFLDWAFKHFSVSIWSAASPDYVDFIAKNIVGAKHRRIQRILNSDNCDQSMELYGDDHLKKLDMLWEHYKLPNHGPDNTVLLDDLCLNMRSQPENCVRVVKFLGTEKFVKDNQLQKVKQKLQDILTHYKKKRRIDKSPIRVKKGGRVERAVKV